MKHFLLMIGNRQYPLMLLAIFSAALIGGCATPKYSDWYKPGASEWDFNQDLNTAWREYAQQREDMIIRDRFSSAISGAPRTSGMQGSLMAMMRGSYLAAGLKKMGWEKESKRRGDLQEQSRLLEKQSRLLAKQKSRLLQKQSNARWRFETGGDVGSSPAIGSDGTVYVGSEDKKLYALNGKSGVKLWEFETGGYVDSSPAIGSDGTVYVGSWDNQLYAIKTESLGLAKSPWPMCGQNARQSGRAIK
jgi:hypothetical protein